MPVAKSLIARSDTTIVSQMKAVRSKSAANALIVASVFICDNVNSHMICQKKMGYVPYIQGN